MTKKLISIRASSRTRGLIDSLAHHLQTTKSEVVARAIELLEDTERTKFLEAQYQSCVEMADRMFDDMALDDEEEQL